MSAVKVRHHGAAVRFAVHVQPRASRSEVAGVHGDALKIRLLAPPVDGAANEALVDFLAEVFAVARRAIRIVSGATSRSKVVEIDGISDEAVQRLVAHTRRE